jgi:glutathione S-transferase
MPFFRKKKKEAVRMKMRGFPGDANTAKCLLMAAEKKVQLDVEVLDVKAGAADEAAYRTLSPFGKYPFLEEGDYSTTSVNAVLSFLDVRGEGTTLLNPKKAQFFGHQNYWCQVSRTQCEPALNVLIDANIYGETGGDTEAACATIDKVLDELNKFVDNKEYIVGDYSFADVHWTAVAHMLCLVGAEDAIRSRSNLSAWFDRVKARPSYLGLPSLDDVKNKQLRSVA